MYYLTHACLGCAAQPEKAGRALLVVAAGRAEAEAEGQAQGTAGGGGNATPLSCYVDVAVRLTKNRSKMVYDRGDRGEQAVALAEQLWHTALAEHGEASLFSLPRPFLFRSHDHYTTSSSRF